MITKHKELYLSLSGQMTSQEQLPLLWAIDPFNKNPGEFAQKGGKEWTYLHSFQELTCNTEGST